jgi:hypothetical protein
VVFGASAGGCRGLEELVEPPEEWLACECAELFALVVAAPMVLPGNAWAATSVSTPVRVTLPAISQRLTRVSLRRAASRPVVLGFPVMAGVWLRSIRPV